MTKRDLFLCLLVFMSGTAAMAQEFNPPRCEILPLPDDHVSFLIDGVEKLRWNFGRQIPRPFFYPFNGPSGVSLTRMGHPGAQNHDHHRSIWFAYQKVNGLDFWSDTAGTQIRQKHWYRYRDGNEEAVMASRLGWFDADDIEVMEQDVIVALRPLADGEHELEVQFTLRSPQGRDSVLLQQTNFGLLAVRVAKSLSEHFGGGQLTSSEGHTGESAIFGKPARWMDYSGPVVVGTGPSRHVVREGITFFDHPHNPRYPTLWHVREDGWMGASYGMKSEQVIDSQNPLTLRYLLHAHSGPCQPDKAQTLQEQFATRNPFTIRGPGFGEKHLQYEVERIVDDSK